MIFSVSRKKGNHSVTIGGGVNGYDGLHFGRVIWTGISGDANYNHEWYRGTGFKKDYNVYARYNLQLSENLSFTSDIQYRHISYKIGGNDDKLRNLSQNHEFNFFNPKFGVFFIPGVNQEIYFSFGKATRSPNR
jgi:iron complex outermembrane receptor protein